MTAALSLALAAWIGFAAHRASLCTVRAVAEVLTTRRAHILASFLKTSLWAIVVSMPLLWLAPGAVRPVEGFALTAAALAGGLLFGVGAAVNGGCSFSTLAHMVEGDLAYLATPVGFVAGVRLGLIRAPEAMLVHAPRPDAAAVALVAVGGLWAAWEIARLVCTRGPGGLRALLGAERYRLSTSALILGLCAGALAMLHGGWSHGSALRRLAATPLHFAMIGAVVVGMALSARQRGAFRVRGAGPAEWARHLVGGLLMGAGAAAIPGGNGWLILRGIPSLSPHALAAYGAILAGVALALLLAGSRRPRVRCTGDICERG